MNGNKIECVDEIRKDSNFFIRCRGLPYSASEKEIRSFFQGKDKDLVLSDLGN